MLFDSFATVSYWLYLVNEVKGSFGKMKRPVMLHLFIFKSVKYLGQK